MRAQQLQLFENRLPEKPYCTDDFQYGLLIRSKIQAIEKRYIQPNGPTRKHWIVIDVDRPGSGYDWDLREAPAPNIVAENKVNLHSHLFYGLTVPVHTNPEAHIKPLRYAAAVEYALVKKLDGDYGYSGLIAKNPLSKYWNVRTYEGCLYDLPWLSDYVDLEPYTDQRKNLPAYGLGRNCTLFYRLRKWSYRARCKVDWFSFDSWYSEVLAKAGVYNDFAAPLPFGELRATAKSIAKWTWENFSAEQFRAIQSARGKRSAEVRRYRAGGKRQLLLALLDDNTSIRDLSKKTGIPKSTVHRLISIPLTISDTSPKRVAKEVG